MICLIALQGVKLYTLPVEINTIKSWCVKGYYYGDVHVRDGMCNEPIELLGDQYCGSFSHPAMLLCIASQIRPLNMLSE